MISRKLWGRQFFLDANRVNARQKLPATNQLEKWEENGVISLRFPEHAQSEGRSDRSEKLEDEQPEMEASEAGRIDVREPAEPIQKRAEEDDERSDRAER